MTVRVAWYLVYLCLPPAAFCILPFRSRGEQAFDLQ